MNSAFLSSTLGKMYNCVTFPQEFLRKSAEARRGGYNKSTGQMGAGERRYAGITMITITPQVKDNSGYRVTIVDSKKNLPLTEAL